MQITHQADGTILLQAEDDNEQNDLGALHLMLCSYGASKMLQGTINFDPFHYQTERGNLEVIPEGCTTAVIEVIKIFPKPVPSVLEHDFINGVCCG